ncbi:PTS sugar transporter subunit IIA [Paenibacillus sp. N1-5-1-14]|uniref:PTS sugar transporter subunit IIA n=1 Tax=Paenibacillus radicibacter TaxID=2972488 RepID=UPI002158DCD1|nr:PTS sugar transporter subunit IIA [Paenibacillus radicibacter]MCR8642682.1 PTS sugar transporter subunit IIA [Paenibacillus radicibacter]
MRIANLMTESSVILSLGARTKEEVIDELIAVLSDEDQVRDAAQLRDAIITREVYESTGIGQGVAIPQATTAAVYDVNLVYGYSEAGLDYESMDDQLAHFFFLIVAPPKRSEDQMDVLSRLAACLGEPAFRANLADAVTPQQVLDVIVAQENALYPRMDTPESIAEDNVEIPLLDRVTNSIAEWWGNNRD